MSSLVNWISSGSTLPSFIDRSSSEFGWLAYVVLETEAVFEQNSKLWKTIQQELISDPGVNTDLALRVNLPNHINPVQYKRDGLVKMYY